MSGFANQIIGGLSKLIRPAIQSPNYVPSSAGWTINQDGSAEFNDATFRGTVIINSAQAALLVYSGVPQAGNLILSISANPGADSFGNTFNSGLTIGTGNSGAEYFELCDRNIQQPIGGIVGGPYNGPNSGVYFEDQRGNVLIGAMNNTNPALNTPYLLLWDAINNFKLQLGTLSSGIGLQVGSGPTGKYYYEEVTLKSPAQTLVSGTVTQLDNLQEGSIASDYGSAWNLATGVWTCPVTGPYDWNIVMGFLGAMANARCFARVCSVFNTAPFYIVDDVPISAGNLLSASGIFEATAGTQYHVEVFQSAGANRQLDTSTSYVHIGRRL